MSRHSSRHLSLEHLEPRRLLSGSPNVSTPSLDADEGTSFGAATPYYRVVGGDVAPLNIWPSVVSLQQPDFGHFCGGTLIAPDLVLTAAHCVVGSTPEDVDAVLGRDDLSSRDGEEIDVAEIVVHPDYSESTFDSDIAILRLSSPSRRSIADYVDPGRTALFAPGTAATVIGWGDLTEGGSGTNRLNQVTVPIVSNAVANTARSYDGQLTTNMLAAGLAQGGKDSCQGDSGGPLMVSDGDESHLVAGVVSWGEGCARPNLYGIYTRVANFATWIDSMLPSSEGSVSFDAQRYAVGDAISISVRDVDLAGTGAVFVEISSSNGQGEKLSLTNLGGGIFRGTVSTVPAGGSPSAGELGVQIGETLTVTYRDADNGDGDPLTVMDTARIIGDEHGNNSATASDATVNGVISGEIEQHGDVDWFRFAASRGTLYRLETRLDTLQDSVITLYARNGRTILTENDDGGVGFASRLFWTAPASGTYFVKVAGYGSNVGTYDLDLSDAPLADDHGDDVRNATSVTVNSETAGNIELPGDADWYRFDAVAGTYYIIQASLDELGDSFLTLLAEDGLTTLDTDDDSGPGLAAQIVWQAPRTDAYFIGVSAYGDSDTGTYQLTVSDEVPSDDHGDDAATATVATVNDTTHGSIEIPGDVDWFRFLAIRGTRYTLTADTDGLGDSLLTLIGEDGTTILREDDDGGSGLAARVSWRAPGTGTYYVQVSGYESNFGTYGLEIDARLNFVPEPGDSNRDGQFDQADIIRVLEAGRYGTGQPAGWTEGDWNGDGRFDQLDILAALQTGNYLQGPYVQ